MGYQNSKDTYPILFDAICSEFSLVSSKGHTGSVTSEILGSICYKGAPTTANVEETVLGLQVELAADDSKLVVLEGFKRLFNIRVSDDTRSINHTWTQKPTVKVITS